MESVNNSTWSVIKLKFKLVLFEEYKEVQRVALKWMCMCQICRWGSWGEGEFELRFSVKLLERENNSERTKGFRSSLNRPEFRLEFE